ncbi:unnamed protein product [Paramecium sonneborni]|uniref:Uncharacterized protein n=1 Tax=Paramecium sonneborni TaxID=65129 RepID=A0A8S1P403_9CILI|nr:unnamed protein product [Paramecium sonneborni]
MLYLLIPKFNNGAPKQNFKGRFNNIKEILSLNASLYFLLKNYEKKLCFAEQFLYLFCFSNLKKLEYIRCFAFEMKNLATQFLSQFQKQFLMIVMIISYLTLNSRTKREEISYQVFIQNCEKLKGINLINEMNKLILCLNLVMKKINYQHHQY